MTNPMGDETAKHNWQTTTASERFALVVTWHNTTSWCFLPRQNVQLKIFNIEIAGSFSILKLIYKQRIDISNIFINLQKSDVESSRQDQTWLDSMSESRKLVVFSTKFLKRVYIIVNYRSNNFWD